MPLIEISAMVGAIMPTIIAVINQPRWPSWGRALATLLLCVAAGAATAAAAGQFTGRSLAESVTVVIGAEHSAPHLRSFSLVASTLVDGSPIRTVGIIGPTRLHYSRAIGVVDGTARAVSRVLRDSN